MTQSFIAIENLYFECKQRADRYCVEKQSGKFEMELYLIEGKHSAIFCEKLEPLYLTRHRIWICRLGLDVNVSLIVSASYIGLHHQLAPL